MSLRLRRLLARVSQHVINDAQFACAQTPPMQRDGSRQFGRVDSQDGHTSASCGPVNERSNWKQKPTSCSIYEAAVVFVHWGRCTKSLNRESPPWTLCWIIHHLAEDDEQCHHAFDWEWGSKHIADLNRLELGHIQISVSWISTGFMEERGLFS